MLFVLLTLRLVWKKEIKGGWMVKLGFHSLFKRMKDIFIW